MDKLMINLSDHCQRTVCLNKVAKGRLGNREDALYGLFVVGALTSFDWSAATTGRGLDPQQTQEW